MLLLSSASEICLRFTILKLWILLLSKLLCWRQSRIRYWSWTRAILKVKKFTVLKRCIQDKFRLQKLGVMKGFFKVKVLSNFDFGDFWKNWSQCHLVAKQLQKIFDLWSTQKYSKVSKICLACSSIFSKVSYMFKPTVCVLMI